MSNTSYITAKRNGTRAGVAEGRTRICITLSEEVFLALRDRAAGRAHTLSGEAALIIEQKLFEAARRLHEAV
jgi:hypothetical protein